MSSYKDMLPDVEKIDWKSYTSRIQQKKASMALMAQEIAELRFVMFECGQSTAAHATSSDIMGNSSH